MRTYVTPMLILLTSLKIVSQKQRNDKPNNAYPLAPRKDFQQEHTLQ
jgi:predicted nucleic acid-binding protein